MTCLWISDDILDPVYLSSEIDDDGWETRKIELWRDGKIGWADKDSEYGNTTLGNKRMPSCTEINKDNQFRSWDIAKSDFERIWESLVVKARL